jgi:hypothetical protein
MLQEVDNFHDFALGPVAAGHIGESGRRVRLVVDLGLEPSAAGPDQDLR